MRIRSKLKSAELDLTPMVDVVFLLIVFFTLVINFAAADQNERVRLPVSELAQPPELPPTEPMTLHVLADGNIIYNGIEYSLEGLQRPIGDHLRFLRVMDISLERVTVIIRGDAQSTYGQIADVIELCRNSNLTRFILRAKQQEE